MKVLNFFSDSSFFNEFNAEVLDVGNVGMHYQASIGYSPHEFNAGVQFPPLFYFYFNTPKSPRNAILLYDQIYNLMSFLLGGELDIEEVFLSISSGFRKKASLYYPRKSIPERHEHSCILFPFGHNIRFDHLCLPALPMDVFSRYFNLDEKIIDYFEKYIRYRRMENIEDF